MTKKPVFDSEEGRKFLQKLQEGVDAISSLKERLASTDTAIRAKAVEELHKITESARDLWERMKTMPPEELQKMKELFQNPANFTPEQRIEQEQIKTKFDKAFSGRKASSKKKTSAKRLKVAKAKKG